MADVADDSPAAPGTVEVSDDITGGEIEVPADLSGPAS